MGKQEIDNYSKSGDTNFLRIGLFGCVSMVSGVESFRNRNMAEDGYEKGLSPVCTGESPFDFRLVFYYLGMVPSIPWTNQSKESISASVIF